MFEDNMKMITYDMEYLIKRSGTKVIDIMCNNLSFELAHSHKIRGN